MAKPPLTPPPQILAPRACDRSHACKHAVQLAILFLLTTLPSHPGLPKNIIIFLVKISYQDDIYEINIILLILLTPLGQNLPPLGKFLTVVP